VAQHAAAQQHKSFRRVTLTGKILQERRHLGCLQVRAILDQQAFFGTADLKVERVGAALQYFLEPSIGCLE
jgi:hypothetical protein